MERAVTPRSPGPNVTVLRLRPNPLEICSREYLVYFCTTRPVHLTAVLRTDVRGNRILDTAGQIRTTATPTDAGWPNRTRDVSYAGNACVVHGSGDFDLTDLNTVRERFPGRRVTLDGNVITVWPPARQR